MTFEEANAIVKSTDDYQKDREATEAFGVKYITWQACRICKHKVICKMASPLAYRCNFLVPREDMYHLMKGLDLAEAST